MSIFEEARKKQVYKLEKAQEKSNKEMEKVLTGLVEQSSYLSIEVCNFVSHFFWVISPGEELVKYVPNKDGIE